MLVRVGSREKIVVGSIMAILMVAGLHFFIFSPRSRALTEAKTRLDNVQRDVLLLGSVKDRKDMDTYVAKTTDYAHEMNKTVTDLNLTFPNYYADPSAPAVEKRREVFTNLIHQLLDLRQKSTTTKLTFLGPFGWDLPESLPDDILRKRVNLWDLIAKLDSLDAMISIAYNPQLKRTKLEEYRLVLLQIGIDQAKVGTEGVPGSLAVAFGDVVPLIKLLVHADLILKEKPEQYKITREKLYKLLRIQFNDPLLVHYNKQIEALLDIIHMAERQKVEDIRAVRLASKIDLFKIEQQEQDAERPRPAAAAIASLRERRESAVDAIGGDAAMEEAASAAAQPEQQEKPRELLAVAVPIKLRISAPNLNATKFLYEVAKSPRTYEIDDMDIWAGRGGSIVVDSTINVLSFVLGLSQPIEQTATASK